VKRNGITTYEFHDAAGRLLLEYTPSDDNQTTEHIYLGDKRVAQRSFNSRTSSSNQCSLDVSGDGSVSANVDGLIVQRYALGLRGDALIQGISNHSPAFITLASNPTSTAATSVNQIQIRLNARFTNSDSANANRATFDIDQDGEALATTDALLIARYLRGGLGSALTSEATNPSGTRGIASNDTGATLITKTQAIQGYLQSLCSDQANGETITYFHNDLIGSPVAATNASGVVQWRESYRAYGDRLTDSDVATQKNSLFFSNKKTEFLKGGATMSYFINRYYDPAIGRFLSVDPVHFKESNIHSFNRYAYANNNPYRFVDPDGNEAEEVEERNRDEEIQVAAASDLEREGKYAGTAGLGGFDRMMRIRENESTLNSIGPRKAFASPGDLGKAGEAAVRSVKDIGDKTSFSVNGRNRISDGTTRTDVSEVKNVARQSYTQQLKDYVDFAGATGRQFNLYTRPETMLSRPLQNAVDQGIFKRFDIPK
jgi:RHS repeat-associated protein